MSSFIFEEMSGSYSWLHGAPQCIYLLFAQKYVLRFAEMIVCFNEKNCKLQNIFAALRIGKYLQHGRAGERSQWPGGGGREQLDDEGREGYFHTTATSYTPTSRAWVTVAFVFYYSKRILLSEQQRIISDHLCVPSWRRPALEPGNVQLYLWLVEQRMAGDAFTAKTMCSPFTDTGAG